MLVGESPDAVATGVVIESNELLQRALASSLAHWNVHVVATSRQLDRGPALVQAHDCDLLVVGIDEDASPAVVYAKLRRVHKLSPRTATIVVVSRNDPTLVDAALAGGAFAAVDRDAAGDVVAAARDATGGGGVDVVVEHVGEATWQRSLQAVRVGGRICVCGATSGPNPPAALHRIWWKQLTILGSTMGMRADFEGAYDLVASGRARPIVDSVFPLAEARGAHERLESGEQFGKVVLRIPE
jgi:D-arabinose 1-dehydrogenase-like Zn-dependent alcohol dehydrogenase